MCKYVYIECIHNKQAMAKHSTLDCSYAFDYSKYLLNSFTYICITQLADVRYAGNYLCWHFVQKH